MGTARRPGQDRDHPRPKPVCLSRSSTKRSRDLPEAKLRSLGDDPLSELFFIHAIELARMLMLMLMDIAPLLPPPVLEPENAGGGIRWYMLAVRRVHRSLGARRHEYLHGIERISDGLVIQAALDPFVCNRALDPFVCNRLPGL